MTLIRVDNDPRTAMRTSTWDRRSRVNSPGSMNVLQLQTLILIAVASLGVISDPVFRLSQWRQKELLDPNADDPREHEDENHRDSRQDRCESLLRKLVRCLAKR